MIKKLVKHSPESTVKALTAMLGILIAYTIFNTFMIVATSNELRDTKLQFTGIELKYEVLKEKLDKE